MAKLSDLVNVNIGRDTVTIQGQQIPIVFTMESFPYVEEAYGKSYVEFEKELNATLNSGTFSMNLKDINLMNCLIYGMVRAGGTECTPAELKASIPFEDLTNVFLTALEVFRKQMFQQNDLATLNTVEKVAQQKQKKNRRKRKGRK